MTKYLQESRMREIRTSGLTRGSSGSGESRPLLSTLPRATRISRAKAQRRKGAKAQRHKVFQNQNIPVWGSDAISAMPIAPMPHALKMRCGTHRLNRMPARLQVGSIPLGGPQANSPAARWLASRPFRWRATGWKPVGHDRRDACPPANLTVLGILPAAILHNIPSHFLRDPEVRGWNVA